MSDSSKGIDPQSIEDSIQMLKRHMGEDNIAALLAVLEALAQDPQNEALIDQLSDTFDQLGIQQGAVLTYAPFIAVALQGRLFKDLE